MKTALEDMFELGCESKRTALHFDPQIADTQAELQRYRSLAWGAWCPVVFPSRQDKITPADWAKDGVVLSAVDGHAASST